MPDPTNREQPMNDLDFIDWCRNAPIVTIAEISRLHTLAMGEKRAIFSVQHNGTEAIVKQDLRLSDLCCLASLRIKVREQEKEIAALEAKLNTPELYEFARAVTSEAQHQRHRWGADHDSGKQPEDWFWLLGYLGGKALAAHKAANTDKALHHTISSAAALANWHAAIMGANTEMRPGIDPKERGVE